MTEGQIAGKDRTPLGLVTALLNAGTPLAFGAPKMRNLVGHDGGISGKFLMKRLNRQLEDVGGLVHIASSGRLKKLKNGFAVQTESGLTLTARKVVLATGIEDIHPEVDNLLRLRKLGLLRYCSICDGFAIRNKPVAVLANDDFGNQKALFIGNWTKDIRIIVPHGLKLSSQRRQEVRSIRAKIIPCKVLRMDPLSGGKGMSVHVDQRAPFACSVAYVELGCQVKDAAFASLKKLRRSKKGFLITTLEQRTSISGLFAVGDCVNLLGQISLASGQAAVAATTIHNDLLEKV